MNKREAFIDFGKTITLLLVVFFHAGIAALGNITYILMTYFFIVFGYCYTKGKRTVRESVLKRFDSILIPFWTAMLIYALFEIFRASYMGYGDASIVIPGLIGALYGSSHNLPYFPFISDKLLEIMSYKTQTPGMVDVILPTNCHLWFLPAMFTGSVLFILFVEKIKKTKIDLIWFTLLMVLLASVETIPGMIQLPYGLGRGFYGCACMIIGYEIKEKELLCDGKKHTTLYIILAMIAIGMYFLGARESALVRSVYGPFGMLGTFITFVGGISACIIILAILKIFEKVDLPLIFYIGKNTMPIYTWHMIFLTLFSPVLLWIFNVEMARDEYFMSIIPEGHTLLMILASILSIACCMLFIKGVAKK